jgi:inner membrane transporter RhtA
MCDGSCVSWLAFAFANALLFALYIVLAHRVARHEAVQGIDGLAASMLIAAVVVTPFGGLQAARAISDPVAILAGIGVGLSSSVIPYVTDQLAMARLERATYSLMVSLLPATATVVGLVVLAQVPSVAELASVAMVVAGVALHRGAGEGADRDLRRTRRYAVAESAVADSAAAAAGGSSATGAG